MKIRKITVTYPKLIVSVCLTLVMMATSKLLLAQSTCTTALSLQAGYACSPYHFTAASNYWFSFTPLSDTAEILIVRDTANNNSFNATVYSGTCKGLIKQIEYLGVNTDTLIIRGVFNYNYCHLLVSGNGGFSVCLRYCPDFDFDILPDTADVGDTVVFRNQSDPVDTTHVDFVWKFYYRPVSPTPILVFEQDTTNSYNDIYFTYPNAGEFQVEMIIYANGILIGDVVKSVHVKAVPSEAYCDCDTLDCQFVSNGDFAKHDLPPGSCGQLSTASCWNKIITQNSPLECMTNEEWCPVLQGTTDYFNADYGGGGGSWPVGVPTNYAGNIYSHTNDYPTQAYAGLYCYLEHQNGALWTPSDYKEYLYQRMPDTLKAGETYTVKFYFSLANISAYSSSLGVLFADQMICQTLNPPMECEHITPPAGSQLIAISPVYNDPTWPYDDSLRTKGTWQEFSADFIASDDYNWLILGNFFDSNDKSVWEYPGVTFIESYSGYTYTSRVSYYFIDDVSITPVDPELPDTSICLGQWITIFADTTYNQWWTSVPYDSTLVGQDSNEVVVISPLVNTTYYLYYANGCIDTFDIEIAPGPDLPEIVGKNNTCDLIADYSITNIEPGMSYTWTLSDSTFSSSVFPQYGTSITVNWNPYQYIYPGNNADHTTLVVQVMDSLTGCYSIDSINIWKCCRRTVSGVTFLNDTTITSYPADTAVVLNGQIIFNADISLNARNVYLAPEASIVVTPPYTFTANNCVITNGCDYMWDGIYLPDSNAKIVTDNGTIIRNAFNSIVSDSGGRFELKNSYLYNNYISLLVRDYFLPPGSGSLPVHKGLVRNCTFSYQTPGMIAPYTGGKPRFGVYADNVYGLTIGDSAQSAYLNTFETLFCGIASFNTRLSVYNNHFGNIKQSGLCYPAIGDYVNVQCETAIHSVATVSDIYHYNSSVLNCGGGGTNSRNTFDTINTGIYTYKALSKIRNNHFYNTALAISLRDFKTGGYICENSTQTSTSYGIKVINTIPNVSGLKMDIFQNTLTDPVYGIQLLNVTSVVNPAGKTKIYNNSISLNGTGNIRHGIRCENSPRVEVYCNNISRTSIPSSSYRLTIRGVQIDQCINSVVRDNTNYNLGVGIKCAGSLLGTQFKCNTSDGNYNGFYFDAAYQTVTTALSSQYNIQSGDTIPNDNKWYNTPGSYYGIDAGATFTQSPVKKWYYRYPGTQYLPSEPFWLLSYIFPFQVGNPPQNSCTSCYSLLMSGSGNTGSIATGNSNSGELNSVITGTNNYNELDVSFKYFEKQYAYSIFKTNVPTTASEIVFFNKLDNGNLGSFDNIAALIELAAFDSAAFYNSSLNPENQIELLKRWVIGVYLESVAKQKSVDQELINPLTELASSSPFVYGDAVYIARAMVDYTENESNDPKSMINSPLNNEEPDSSRQIKLYPNPANTYIMVEIEGILEEELQFTMFNSLGYCVKQDLIRNNLTRIDVHDINLGIYFYQLIQNGSMMKTGRIVLIK